MHDRHLHNDTCGLSRGEQSHPRARSARQRRAGRRRRGEREQAPSLTGGSHIRWY